jgi:hypothetical protein
MVGGYADIPKIQDLAENIFFGKNQDFETIEASTYEEEASVSKKADDEKGLKGSGSNDK